MVSPGTGQFDFHIPEELSLVGMNIDSEKRVVRNWGDANSPRQAISLILTRRGLFNFIVVLIFATSTRLRGVYEKII